MGMSNAKGILAGILSAMSIARQLFCALTIMFFMYANGCRLVGCGCIQVWYAMGWQSGGL
jgi:hypothetical protein